MNKVSRMTKQSLPLRAFMMICLLCGVSSASFSDAASERRPVLLSSTDAKDIIERVQKKYEDIDDAVVSFSQSTRFKVSRVEQSVNGTLYFKKKNKYRIETQDRIVVTNGITSWSYSPGTNQVVIDNYRKDARALSPEQLLTSYPENFYSTLVGEEEIDGKTTYVLKLTPKEEHSFASAMKLWVGKDWLLKRIQITDVGGAVTEYRIKNVLINKGIDDRKFSFDIPSGAERIDMR
jgi:outer membrane lipoprotein carrier protein